MKKKKGEFGFTFTKDGEPIVMPQYDESELIEMSKRWNKLLRQTQEENKAMEAQFRESNDKAIIERWQKYGITITDAQRQWEEIGQRLDAGRGMNREYFHREFPAIRAYLEGKNMILPTDSEEFLRWFIYVKHGKRPFGAMIANWPKMELSDFREFHRYKEHLFEHGGEVGDYPPSWQQIESRGKVELRPAFAALFLSDNAAHKALEAAMIAGIIDETGKKKLGVRKIVPAIIQFWEAVSDPKFELTHIRALKEAVTETYLQPCQTIAERFRTTIGKTAINDNAGKRTDKYFTAVARALSGT